MKPTLLRHATPSVHRLSARWLSACAIALLLSACASAPQAPPQLALAETAVQRASTPSTLAHAPAQLQIATDKLAAAYAAFAAGDPERARLLAEQAEIDARVAEWHAERVRSANAAKASQDATQALAEEIQRKTVR